MAFKVFDLMTNCVR